ncbi:MAG: hypothetical protein K0R90_737 [Oscillospiraceae bacterium]|nr:hypothetical protein [Oscillospiraceae bacterium]
MDSNFILSLAIAGLIAVLLVLILLIVFIAKVGSMMNSLKDKNGSVQQSNFAATPRPVVQSGISGEVVAAISAAVAMMMNDGNGETKYVVRSVKRAKESRPAWGFAGISENTKPF